MAEALNQQAMQPMELPTQAGVRVSPYAGLAKMLQGYTSGMMQNQAQTQQAELGKRYAADTGADFQSLMKALTAPGQAAVPEGAPTYTPNVGAGELADNARMTMQPERNEMGEIIQPGQLGAGNFGITPGAPAQAARLAGQLTPEGFGAMRTPMGQQQYMSQLLAQIAPKAPIKLGKEESLLDPRSYAVLARGPVDTEKGLAPLNQKDIFRPGHADFTYFHKYGIRDYRGGGRSSARETAARVAAGAVAKLMLKELNIEVLSGICEVDGIKSEIFDYEAAKNSLIYALDPNKEQAQKDAILRAKNDHDSVGGISRVVVKGAPTGLGQPLYYKLDAILADAMMGINAVKAVEIGDGVLSASTKGSQNNDEIRANGFLSNHSGGILGGISNADEIVINVYFKPTPSIFKEQKTVNIYNEEVDFSLKGRHDPCVAIRGTVVCEAMAALVIADMLLLNMGSKMDRVVNYYR
jgi:chorismate synthase